MVVKNELLVKIPFFAGLRPESPALQVLAQAVSEEKYDSGQILFLEEEPCRGIYFVVQGTVRIFKSEPGGREQVLRIAGVGGTFNEVPVFDGGNSPASAEALAPTVVWIIPAKAVMELMAAEPAVAQAITKILANRLRHLTTLIAEISLKQVTARVAKILLSQLENEPVLGVGISNQITGQLTQQQMASIAGTVRDMVGRALRTMQKSGAIEARRGYLIVKDRVALQEYL